MKLWAEKNNMPRPNNRAFSERAGAWLANIKDKRIQARHARKHTEEEEPEDEFEYFGCFI